MSELTRLEVLKTDRFKTIDLNAIDNNPEMSWKAKGIWVYLVSRPPNWKFYTSDLLKRSTDGKTSVRGGFKELQDLGYLLIQKIQDRKGRWVGTKWVVTEDPKKLPLPKTAVIHVDSVRDDRNAEKRDSGERAPSIYHGSNDHSQEETIFKEKSKALENSHKVTPEPQPEKPQKPKAMSSSKDNKKTDYSHKVILPYKFTSVSDCLAFPDVSFDEKCKNLIKNRANLNQREMVGLLGDILIQNASNAKDFLTAAGGIKPVYSVIGLMLNKFPLEYLLHFFERPRIPLKPKAPWDRYFWGAVKREYAYWSADEEIARSAKVKEEEAESLDELAEIMKDMRDGDTTGKMRRVGNDN